MLQEKTMALIRMPIQREELAGEGIQTCKSIDIWLALMKTTIMTKATMMTKSNRIFYKCILGCGRFGDT